MPVHMHVHAGTTTYMSFRSALMSLELTSDFIMMCFVRVCSCIGARWQSAPSTRPTAGHDSTAVPDKEAAGAKQFY